MMGRHSRSAAVVGALLVLLTVVTVGCGGTGTGGGTLAKTAPDFSGVTLEGTRVSLNEFRGNPLVLAFMASW
jgi:hypothetical protein